MRKVLIIIKKAWFSIVEPRFFVSLKRIPK
nr:MAG TPA: hypothetical protein [Caudoviricetes sp.]